MPDSEQDRQIVVATDQVRLVLGELDDGQVARTTPNPRLGLTLVTFHDADAVGVTLAERRRDECRDPRSAPLPTAVDGILDDLRHLFRQRYAGWTPTMGKNRTLTGVQFKPYTHGGYDKPTPAEPVAMNPSTPAAAPRSVRVGLFDSRFAPHTNLTGAYFADDDALIRPVPDGRQRQWWEGHSTFIAGLIRQRAPHAVLDVRTALQSRMPADADADPDTDANWTLPLWDFAERLGDYQDAGVAVINLSVGLATFDNQPPLVLERAVAQLTPNVVLVAAAGNHGSASLSEEHRELNKMPGRSAALFPAALDNVVAVGARHGENGPAADFNPVDTHTGGWAPWIDVFAEGVELTSTYLGDAGGEKVLVRDSAGEEETVDFAGWASWSGTSFAAGVVTAAAADLFAAGHTAPEVVAALREQFPRP